jgi:beta-lactamase regulating signal transducer with metallopeptidase domain
MPGSADLLWSLAGWSVRSAILASAAGLCLRTFRVRDVSLRLTVWTVVLCGALTMPLLSSLAPAVEVPVPKWQADQPASAARALLSAELVHPMRLQRAPVHNEHPASNVNWPSLLTGLWAAIAIAMLGQLAVGIFCGRRLIRAAVRINMPCAAAVYESESVRVPITLGSSKPVIVLPPGWRAWEERKLAAVLAHESAHVQRCDPLRQLLASIYRAVFWFHPLAWWLHRELADLAESASDDAALVATRDETFYAEVLLNFFASAPRRVQWDAVAMAVQGKATKRMERILNTGRKLSRGVSAMGLAGILAATVPALYFATSATPVWALVNGQEPPPAPAAPPAPKPSGGIVEGVIGGTPGGIVEGVIEGVPGGVQGGVSGGVSGGIPAVAPEPDLSPEAEWDDGDHFAIVSGNNIVGATGPGERERLAAVRKRLGTDFLWFHQGSDQYITQEQAGVEEMKKTFDALSREGLNGENGRAQAEAIRKMGEAIRRKIQHQYAELQRLSEQLQAQFANDETWKDLESQMRELQKQFSDKNSDFAKMQRDLQKQFKSMELDVNRGLEQLQEQLKNLEKELLRSKKAEKII